MGTQKKYFIATFGCQMNAHDSERLAGMLCEMGYSQAEKETEADIVVYNTCCVRENAENRVFGRIGILKNIKKTKKDLKIILCGCMMQQDTIVEKIKKSYKQVDIILGTYNLHRLPELLRTNIETNAMVIDVWKEHEEIVEDLPAIREFLHKASVNIMFGCNNFCTYCIVPYVRGRERSRLSDDIIKEVKELAADGVKEITLLGQNVNSYGLGLSEKITFAGLLRLVSEVEGIERIKFLTSHPKDLSDELIDTIAELDKVCNYIHLPFQSGSSEILRKMNRRYTKEEYLGLIDRIKGKIPNVSISTDIIVGFPSETEEDFLDTLEVARSVRFSAVFTFLYSKRTGTPAANMEEQVPDEVANERFQRLLDVIKPIIFEINKGRVGQVLSILPDGGKNGETGPYTGRADDNTIVHFNGDDSCIGEIVAVKIIEAKPFCLIGEMVNI